MPNLAAQRAARERAAQIRDARLSPEAKQVLSLSSNLLRVPRDVFIEVFEYVRHSNAQYAIDAMREAEQDGAFGHDGSIPSAPLRYRSNLD